MHVSVDVFPGPLIEIPQNHYAEGKRQGRRAYNYSMHMAICIHGTAERQLVIEVLRRPHPSILVYTIS